MNEKGAEVKAGIFVEMTKPQQAYLKMGIFGEAGAGKSFTAAAVAIGLHKHIRSQKPVAYFDTETGSDFLLSRFHDAKIKLFTLKSRAFKDLSEAIPQAEGICDVLIIDSLTHPWNELLKSYLRSRKDGGRFIRIQDWGPIKEQWSVGFSVPYVSSKLHILWCARSANIFEDVEDADAPEGRTQFKAVKVGTKARSETETAYEPSLLVEMTKVMLHEGGKYVRRANVIKDRFDAIDSEEFDNPTFESFLPHITRLSLGGEHFPLDKERTSDALFTDSDRSVVELRKRRQIALEKIENALAFAFPSRSADDKKANLAILLGAFGTDSWTEISDFHPDRLEGAFIVISQICRLAIKGEKIADYTTETRKLLIESEPPEKDTQTQRQQHQGERTEPEKAFPTVREETPSTQASGEATGASPGKPASTKDSGTVATQGQWDRIAALLESGLLNDQERETYMAELKTASKQRASGLEGRIKKALWSREKAVKSSRASAAFDDPGERPSYLGVIENYLKANGQDELVKGAGELRLKRIREGEKATEASLIEWIRNLHYNLTDEVLTEGDVQKRFAKNDWPFTKPFIGSGGE